MKFIILSFLLSCFTQFATAQYTYISDRRFFSVEDLVGYDFKPDKKEIPNYSEEDLSPGEYSFGITQNNLYVEGEGIRGVYNINNISPENYGYKLLLMNARDARLQGHLKVILNKYAMVELVIFKRSPEDKEIIFYLPPIPGKLNAQEKGYFTDRGELVFEESDSIWGKAIYPFFRIHLDENVQEPLSMVDSTSIRFLKEITIEEKVKKPKKKSKKEQEVVVENEILDIEVIDSSLVNSEELAEKKVKIITEYFVEVKTLFKYDDGGIEYKTKKYPVKRISEKEDELARMDEEKYQWQFVSDKEEIYLYLNGDKTVSTMEIGQKKYLMRGF